MSAEAEVNPLSCAEASRSFPGASPRESPQRTGPRSLGRSGGGEEGEPRARRKRPPAAAWLGVERRRRVAAAASTMQSPLKVEKGRGGAKE